jgi:Condensation domain/TubC N-terminal docking domain
MSEVTDLLSSMSNKGVRLWVEDDRLRYRAARGVLGPTEIEAIREMKGEILAELSRRQASSPVARSPPTRFPLTFQQEAYWAFFCAHNPTWNHSIPSALRLRGMLDVESLRRALRKVTERHESLRTRFCYVDGSLIQEVDEPVEDRLEVFTLDSKESDDVDGRARQFLERFLNSSADPAVGPLVRAQLLMLSDLEYVLALGVHHALSDAMSVSLLFRELWALYSDFRQGRSCSLTDVPMQYSDYGSWQRSMRLGWQESHGIYWKTKLSGASRLRLPVDVGLEHVRPFRPEQLQISFGETLSSALHELARTERTSLPFVMLGIYSAVASIWCKQRDFVLPFNITGRCNSEHVNIMGLFFHSLLLRIELTGQETFIELLRQVSQEFFTAHQHLDFGTLLPDFPHLFEGTILQCLSLDPDEVAGVATLPGGEDAELRLAVEPFPVELSVIPDSCRMNSDTAVGFQNTAQGICAAARYRTDLFAAITIGAFLQDLRRFAEFVVENPAAPVSAFRAASNREVDRTG